MRKIILFYIFCFISNKFVNAQVNAIEVETNHFCGLDISNFSNPNARLMNNGNLSPLTTPKSSYPANAIFNCGAFRLYYEDIALGTNDGFADPTNGADKRATLCAVYQYIQTIFDFSNIPSSDPITIEIQRSFTIANPPPVTGVLASAAPVYLNPSIQGIYNGSLLNHVLSNSSPDPTLFDAHIQVNFQQSFHNTTSLPVPNCYYDLYTVLLHEVGHQLGFISLLEEDASQRPKSKFGNNQYSLFDWQNIWHGNINSTSSFEKIVTGTITSPEINPLITNSTNYLRDESLWLTNQGRFFGNIPLYSGTYIPGFAPHLSIGSVASHICGDVASFTNRFSLSPGYRKGFTMSPMIDDGESEREYTDEEIRIFLNLGYTLNPVFAASTSINGLNTNGSIISNNHAPTTTKQVTSLGAFSPTFPDLVQLPDFPPLVNNGTSLTITLDQDASISDVDGDPVSVENNTLFNIRGCGINGNNHDCITLNTTRTEITYTPRANFIGRAQFGFYLHDGKERGSFMVYTIDVVPGTSFLNTSNINTPLGSSELIVNGDFEEATEVRTVGTFASESAFNTNLQYGNEEGLYFGGVHFSDAHPLQSTNRSFDVTGGIVIANTQKGCNSGVTPIQFGTNYVTAPNLIYNNPVPINGTNYSFLMGGYNYHTLASPLVTCHKYVINFNVNFDGLGLAVGSTYTSNITVNSNAVYPASTPLQTIPVAITVGSGWQTVSVPFNYCGGATNKFINFIGNSTLVKYDNVSLTEDFSASATTTANASASNSQICLGTSTVLTGSITGSFCNSIYTWQPGNLTGASVTVSPSTNTIYTLTVTDGCSAATAVTTTSVTVKPLPTVTVTSPSVCIGQSTNVTASGANTYLWNTGSTNATITVFPFSTTSYTVTGTATNGCTAQATSTVTVLPLPSFFVSSPSICLGQTATMTASGANSYLWSTGSTTNSITATPTVTTTYTVTGTGTNGCSSQRTATVTVKPLPSVAVTSTTTCSGQIVTIAASGANNYLWSTGANTTSIMVNPTSTTTYTVTGTNTTTGCSASAISTVTVINPISPIASFNCPDYDKVVGFPVAFISTSTNAVSYLWEFMDGTTSTSSFTSKTFTIPGYYRVKLTVQNSCGVASSTSKDIYIIPNSGSYSPNPTCLGNFDYTNPIIGAGPDFVINSPTTGAPWNSGGIIYIKGTLTIKAGGSLTVSNGTTVAFGPQGKVIVEAASGALARGLLTIDNAKFTGINFVDCGATGVKMMWQGIEVWGTTTSTSPTYQGRINLINGALIEDAYVGVLLGKSSLAQLTSTSFSFNNHVTQANGGIITTNGAKFNRNGVGIWFWGEGANHAPCTIKNSQFTCKDALGNNTSLLDPTPYYNSSGNTISQHNPFYYPTAIGSSTTNAKSFTHVFQAFSKGVKIYDNNFDNASYGVSSTDAAYTLAKSTAVEGNTFNNVYNGVVSSQTVSSPKAFNVNGNTFRNFSYGVNLNGAQNIRISKNKFNPDNNPPTSSPTYFYQKAIYAISTSAYTIVDNNFNNLTEAMRIDNSGSTAALVGYENGGNIFTQCRKSIVTENNNSMLNIRCNGFENPSLTNYSGTNWSISGTLQNQGQATSTNDTKAPAGNTFNLSTQLNARKEVDAFNTPLFNYYTHTNPFTIPTKLLPTSTFNVLTNSVAMTSVSASCAPVSCGLTCRMALIEKRNKIAELQLELINVQNFLDKGRTAELLEAIQSNIPVNTLKDMLNDASPLSDVVLKALINKAVPLPPQVFHEIIKRNSPVDELVNPHLENKLRNMPPTVADMIRKEQVISEPYRTPTTIKNELIATENERQLLLNQAVNYSLQNDSIPDEIISMLEEETTIEAKRNLVGMYIEKRDFVAASNKLNTLNAQNPEEIAYKELHSIYIDLGTNNKNLWEMDELQKAKVREIAAICPEGLAVLNARAVMAIVFGEQAPTCLVNNARVATNTISENMDVIVDYNPLMYNNISYLGNNIPNPFKLSTNIPYQLPQDVSEGVLQIKDMQGKLLKSIIITKDKASAEINMDELENGVYTYSLYINNALIETKRMILMK